MEDVLEVYVRDYNERFPQVCVDEGSVQLKGEKTPPLAMQPGKAKKEDYEYMHKGVCSIFLACEPLTGKRFTEVTERRKRADFAHFLQRLVDIEYPQAEKIILVMDNLNTHTPGTLYDVFPAEEAMRIWKKLEIHFTPTHASWLNMAEIELSVLGRQVLKERLETRELVQQRVADWQAKRNAQKAIIHWRFTTDDARIKLARLYPVERTSTISHSSRNEA